MIGIIFFNSYILDETTGVKVVWILKKSFMKE
jgi:hypothetical protein